METMASVAHRQLAETGQVLGRHVLCEFWECNRDVLNSRRVLVTALRRAVKAAGGTLLGIKSHAFKPHGVSAVALLGESHMSIHTWPELGYAAVDVFTSGATMDPYRAVDLLSRVLRAARAVVREVPRGPGLGQNG
jgi:S-adenosylmethionine decarboxylase